MERDRTEEVSSLGSNRDSITYVAAGALGAEAVAGLKSMFTDGLLAGFDGF